MERKHKKNGANEESVRLHKITLQLGNIRMSRVGQ
jgi:hypothetical protein